MTPFIPVHESLATIRLTPLFAIELTVSGLHKFPGDSHGQQMAVVAGGRFSGERLSGRVLPGGNDWMTVLSDGALLIDAKVPLACDDGAAIIMSYRGARVASPEMTARMAAGEAVDPALYYFRVSASFRTYDPRYDWLNRIVAVGTGQRLSAGPIYQLFQVE